MITSNLEANWKEFKVKDVFNIERPSARKKTDYNDGLIPFVASGNYNNGVERYVTQLLNEHLDKENCITVSPLTGTAYYQDKPFLGRGGAGSSILILRNENLNYNRGLFICTIISKVCQKYSYEDMGNQKRLENESIWLPCLSGNEIDWDFMDSYIAALKIGIESKIAIIKSI
ncbi:restriction endonuclease subunit S [Bartonella sp. MR30HLJHH]|uniref:restriction endonuclease subunit S n=1 Tax=Bartonella sp. MR30HLJHH TaxID=3243557 RepID=UPI0035CFF5E0